MSRKTPILLRRGPMSGRVVALYRYTRKQVGDTEILKAALDGKQDVSSDFDALVLMELVDDGAEDIVGILDGVADGETLNDEERGQVRVFRERLKALILRHNARLDQYSEPRPNSAPPPGVSPPSEQAPQSVGGEGSSHEHGRERS